MNPGLDALLAEADRDGGEAARLRFHVAFAGAPLWLVLETEASETLRPLVYPLKSGPTAIAYDSEDRFAASIGAPTPHALLSGRAVALKLGRQGVALALNPGSSGAETVLDPATLAWIGETFAADVAPDAAGEAGVGAPVDPGAPFLEALGRRIADLAGGLREAWLTGHGDDLVLVVRTTGAGGQLLVEDLARAGQIATDRPFAVAPVDAGSSLLVRARRFGIGLLDEAP